MEDITRRFFELLDKDLNECCYHLTKKSTIEQYKYDSINKILNGRRKRKNIWFAVNDFDFIYRSFKTKNGGELTYKWIVRQSDKVKRFNAFYVDVDFKDENNNHLSDEELQRKKEEVYNKLMNLKLKPSAVVNSRNGFHVYYIINKNDRNKLTLENWKHQEIAIHQFLNNNVSEDVDKAVKDASRILRLAETVHKKDDSEDFLIQVKYVNQTYSLDELKEAFPILQEVKKQSKKKEGKEQKQDFAVNSQNDIVLNLINLNADFFDYVQKYDVDADWDEAINLINQYDIREFFCLDVRLNESFSSIFRTDKKPSCVISCTDDIYYYRDFAQEHSYNLTGLVSKIANIEFTQAVKFLAKVFNIRIKNTFNNSKKDITKMIAYNADVLKQVAKENKDLKFLFKLIDVYKTICQVWERVTEENNINNPADVELQLSSRFLAKKSNIKKTTAKNYLDTLEALNIIKQVKSKSNIEKFKNKTNCYLVCKLDKEKLTNRAKDLNEYCSNKVLTNMSADICLRFIFKQNGFEIERFTA